MEALINDVSQGITKEQLDKLLNNFEAHARIWSDLTQLVCTMSNNTEAVKISKMARKQLESLVPYVVGSAQIYANFSGQFKEVVENMQVIRSRWLNQIELLKLTIDDVIGINDFLGNNIKKKIYIKNFRL